MKLKGHADFLAEPHVAFKGDFQVEKVALDYFRPITERYQFSVSGFFYRRDIRNTKFQ